jgi:hypothetical protein
MYAGTSLVPGCGSENFHSLQTNEEPSRRDSNVTASARITTTSSAKIVTQRDPAWWAL